MSIILICCFAFCYIGLAIAAILIIKLVLYNRKQEVYSAKKYEDGNSHKADKSLSMMVNPNTVSTLVNESDESDEDMLYLLMEINALQNQIQNTESS